jgi:hypothetical protein
VILPEHEANYRAEHPGEIRVYDVNTDDYRPASQEDFDRMQDFFGAISRLNSKIEEHREADQIGSNFGFELAVFPNRLRDDGVFVAQDLPIEPYEHITNLDGSKCYPAVPQKGYRIWRQLPHAFAFELVWRWNDYPRLAARLRVLVHDEDQAEAAAKRLYERETQNLTGHTWDWNKASEAVKEKFRVRAKEGSRPKVLDDI